MAFWGIDDKELPAMSFQEIADEMGLTLNEVKWIYRRAMRKLAVANWKPAVDLLAVLDEDRCYASAIRTSGVN